jgi:hypothetical protein
LPDVKTFIYSGQQTGRRAAVTEWRRTRCRQVMAALGFTDWSFFEGRQSRPYWTGLPRDHALLLRRHDPPLLILEDDIEVVDFRANVRPPGGCQVAYLGGFRSGDSRGVRNAKRAGLCPLLAHRYGYLPIDSEWMRIFGMWGSHAILWLDRAAMDEAACLLESSVCPIDTTLACEQWRWQVHCGLVPWFFQNDGHHVWDTEDYRPGSAGGDA